MQAITTVAIHMTRREQGPVIPAVQGDTGREVWFSVLDMEVPETASARLYALKPDGWAVYNDCALRRVDGISTVCAPLTAQLLAAPGPAVCQIQLLEGDSLVTSFPFTLEIRATRVDGTALKSSNEFGALTQALSQVQGYGAAIAAAAQAADRAQGAADQAQKTADQALPRSGGALTGALSVPALQVDNAGVADFVTDQGSVESWTYRKWKSGVAECWGKVQVTYANTNTLLAIVNLPFTFSSVSSAVGTLNNLDNNARNALVWNIKIEIPNPGQLTVGLHNDNGGFDTSSKEDVSVHVLGRWK